MPQLSGLNADFQVSLRRRGDTTRARSVERESRNLRNARDFRCLFMGAWQWGLSPVCNNSGDFVNTNLSACYVLVSVQLLHVSRRQKTSKEKQEKENIGKGQEKCVRARESWKEGKAWKKKTRQQKKKQPPPHWMFLIFSFCSFAWPGAKSF